MGCLLTLLGFVAIFALLIIIGLLLTLALVTGGVLSIFFFSDVIIAAFILVWLIKKCFKKK